MIGLGIDSGLLLRALHGALTAVGRDQPMNTALSAADAPAPKGT